MRKINIYLNYIEYITKNCLKRDLRQILSSDGSKFCLVMGQQIEILFR